MSNWVGRIERGISLRVILLSMIGGGIVGAVASAAWAPLGVPVTLVVWVGLWFLMVMNDGQMVRCDACGKRVKMGYSTCHHCGYSRA